MGQEIEYCITEFKQYEPYLSNIWFWMHWSSNHLLHDAFKAYVDKWLNKAIFLILIYIFPRILSFANAADIAALLWNIEIAIFILGIKQVECEKLNVIFH